MGILLAIALLLIPGEVEGQQAVSARLVIAPEVAPALPPAAAIEAGLRRHFERVYGGVVELSFDDEPAPGGGPAPGAEKAVVTIRPGTDAPGAGALSVSTDLARGAATRSVDSTVPRGAWASLLATIASDMVFLHVALSGFAALPLSPPPPLEAALQTDTLSKLAPWSPAELEPVGLASVDDGVLVCFPHRYLTLGPSFTITDATVRDIDAQAAGRDPVQASAVAAGAGGEIVLVSERDGAIVRLNPRLGTRQALAAPGLAGTGARMLGPGAVAVLSSSPGSAGLDIFSFAGGDRRRLPIHAAYVSAFSRDREGNFWVWDAGERRIRILAPGGQEVYAIRPLVSAATMPLPQQIEVLDDGSFLLGGSGEVWKFQATGVPAWRLTRIPGRPVEQLPSSFALAANPADGSFFLLDAPSRRILMFGAGSSDTVSPFAQALARMDSRSAADLHLAAGLALRAGFSLVAWQLGAALADRGGPLGDREEARVAVLRERSARYAQLADSLARDLLFDRADAAYGHAAESARELTDESPTDPEGAALLARVLAARQEMRAGFGRRPGIRVTSATAEVRWAEACRAMLVVKIGLRNVDAEPVTSLRVHLSALPVSPAPSLSALGSLAPGQERTLEVPLDLAEDWTATVRVALLVTYQRGTEGIAVRASLDVPVTASAPPMPADLLACRVDGRDPLVAGLADDLLAGGAPATGPGWDATAALAAILDTLGALRAERDATEGAAPPGLRETLRSLSPSETGWTLLTVSAAATLGLRAGLLSWQDRVFAIVDTGIPLVEAVSDVPGLARYAGVLDTLSSSGSLCVPVSGGLPAAATGASGWAIADALRECARRGMGTARTWWWDARSAAGPVPAPFPLPLPAIRVAASRDTLRAEIIRSLEQQK